MTLATSIMDKCSYMAVRQIETDVSFVTRKCQNQAQIMNVWIQMDVLGVGVYARYMPKYLLSTCLIIDKLDTHIEFNCWVELMRTSDISNSTQKEGKVGDGCVGTHAAQGSTDTD